MSEDLRFPIGKFKAPEIITAEDRASWIEAIAATPANLRQAIAGLTSQQLDTPYREGGWTVRQVVHHVPDSHMNAFIRFKLALTEIDPVIKPYQEAEWAKLNDATETPIETSLLLLDKLHERWEIVLRGIAEESWKGRYMHPELGPTPLERALGLYAWHGKHHTAHITELRKRNGW
jgi:hypothetical protein